MYSDKLNVRLVVATLKAYGVKKVILSPGSRNAPLIHTFLNCIDTDGEKTFQCQTIIDERSAAFFALGIADYNQAYNNNEPVVICCTSGSALLQYSPAIAEAFYKKRRLIIISADRPAAWIDQLDGQTINQANIFNNITCNSISIPEPCNEEEEWYCQRLLHESMLAIEQYNQPIHINIPIAEPLFNFVSAKLPIITPIKIVESKTWEFTDELIEILKASKRRMIIYGQETGVSNKYNFPKTDYFVYIYENLLHQQNGYSIFEHKLIRIEKFKDEKRNALPDLVIYVGGHIISKRLKQFIRQNKPQHIWRVDDIGKLSDVFQGVTTILKCSPSEFNKSLEKIKEIPFDVDNKFLDFWNYDFEKDETINEALPYSDIRVVQSFAYAMMNKNKKAEKNDIFFANSSAIRLSQLFKFPQCSNIFCNRGVNGIDGTIATVAGFSSMKQNEIVFLVTGDLSFFYDIGFLAEEKKIKNIRILLINNGGGAIFDTLPIPQRAKESKKAIGAINNRKAEKWLNTDVVHYMSATTEHELSEGMVHFVNDDFSKIVVFEIFTNREISLETLKNYNGTIQKI